MRLILVGIATLVTTIGSAAFAQDKPAPDAAPATAPKVLQTPPTVKLLEAGNEPRSVLRLKPKAGDTETVVMTMRMNNEMEMGGAKRPMPRNPPSVLTTRVLIDSVGPEGDIHCTATIVKAEAGSTEGSDAKSVEATKAMLAGVPGLTFKMVISDRGFTRLIEVQPVKASTPGVSQMIKNVNDSLSKVSMPLPEEPIGVGARWQSEGAVTSNGLTIDQTATYTLVSRAERSFGVESDVKQTAKPQEIKDPKMPAGMTINLKSLDGQVRGKTETSGVMPSKGEVVVHSVVETLVDMGGNKQQMKQTVNMTITFAPAGLEGEKPKETKPEADKPAGDGKK